MMLLDAALLLHFVCAQRTWQQVSPETTLKMVGPAVCQLAIDSTLIYFAKAANSTPHPLIYKEPTTRHHLTIVSLHK
jgi:hypothetical protein